MKRVDVDNGKIHEGIPGTGNFTEVGTISPAPPRKGPIIGLRLGTTLASAPMPL